MTVSDRELVLTDEFRTALALLAAGRHLFLTGKAGTGKSTLIRHFIAKPIAVVVVAPPASRPSTSTATPSTGCSVSPPHHLSDVDGGLPARPVRADPGRWRR